MRRIRATDFRTRCLEILDEVHATGDSVVVTRRGKPIVKIVRVAPTGGDIFGFMKDKAEIVGDIESPIPEWSTGKRRPRRRGQRPAKKR